MKKVFIFLFLYFLVFTSIVFGQDVPQQPQQPQENNQAQLIDIIRGIVYSLSVLFIIIGGYKIVTSEGDPGRVQEGKRAIIYALIGLGIALATESIVDYLKNIE